MEDLYREIVLDHYKAPRHFGKLTGANWTEKGANPLCGDELEIDLIFKDGKVEDIRFEGKGCSISQASASIMTEAVIGKSLAEIEALVGEFKSMMLENKPVDTLSDSLEDAKALEGVKKYPVRVKCAVLSWNTLVLALKRYKEKSASRT